MQVETYEVEQNPSEASEMAKDGAALELIEKLGLKGQQRCLLPATATRNPYRAMEKREKLIYGALLTEKAALEDYDADAIPLRVLQVAAHAKECGFFSRLEVWYPSSAVIREDPILVGHVGSGNWDVKLHLLARWGKSLMSLDALEELAISVLKPKRIDQVRSILEKAKARLIVLEQSKSLETLENEPTAYHLD